MKPANTCEIGRMAQRPRHTKQDEAANETTAKTSNANQTSKTKGGSGNHGYFARIDITAGL